MKITGPRCASVLNYITWSKLFIFNFEKNATTGTVKYVCCFGWGVDVGLLGVVGPSKRVSDPNQLLATAQRRLAETGGSHLSITRCTTAFLKATNRRKITLHVRGFDLYSQSGSTPRYLLNEYKSLKKSNFVDLNWNLLGPLWRTSKL